MKTAEAIGHIGQCHECRGKSFKRVYKKTFPAVFDSSGVDLPAPDKVEWRAFECKSCECLNHVCNIGDDVQVTGDSPCLPPSAYDWFFSIEDGFCFEAFVTDQVPEDYLHYDDLRDEHLFGVIQRLQHKYGILVSNCMENAWELMVDVGRKSEFPDYQSLYDFFMDALTEVMGQEGKCPQYYSSFDEMRSGLGDELEGKLYEEAFFDVEERTAFLKELMGNTYPTDNNTFQVRQKDFGE